MTFALCGLVNVLYGVNENFYQFGPLSNYLMAWVLLIISCVYPFVCSLLVYKNLIFLCKEKPGTETFSVIYEEMYIPKTWQKVYKYNNGKPSVYNLFYR